MRTRKGFKSEDAIPVVSEALRLFPTVDVFYVWGFPFETMRDFEKSLFQMITFRMMGARVLPSLLCLLPQTQIYRDYMGSGTLQFCKELFPEYMVTGHEVRHSTRINILEKHRKIFEFIEQYPHIFPGFFQVDSEENLLPKLEILEKFGFYPPRDKPAIDMESCGAHSPSLSAQLQ